VTPEGREETDPLSDCMRFHSRSLLLKFGSV
jgi:hypothetical protein